MEFSLAWRLLSSGKGQGQRRALGALIFPELAARKLLRAQGLCPTQLGLGEKALGAQSTPPPLRKRGGPLGGFQRPGHQLLPHSAASTSQSLGWNKRLGSLGNGRVFGLSQSTRWAWGRGLGGQPGRR